MDKTDKKYVIVGKIGSTYGVHGWLKIRSYTEFGTDILNYSPWFLSTNTEAKDLVAVTVEEGRVHGKGIIVKLKEYHSKEHAQELNQRIIFIDHSQLPKLQHNEYYWSDLIGLTVINQANGTVIGKVKQLIATGSNDVMIVETMPNTEGPPAPKQIAIPYLPERVVLGIDLNKGEIVVNWEII